MEYRDDQEKLVEAAVALLESAPGQRMQVTNLNKGLFYLDLTALRDRGETLTGRAYLAMRQGPVLHGYRDELIPELTARDLARQDDEGMGKPVVLTGRLQSFRFMDDYLRAKAKDVAQFVASHSAGGISERSHKNPGWTIAWEKGGKRNLAPAPIDMLIALQEIVDSDPWVSERSDDEFISRVESNADDVTPW
jgi:Protein of unknown function (DUF4065)